MDNTEIDIKDTELSSIKTKIQETVTKMQKEYELNQVSPENIYLLSQYLSELKNKNITTDFIFDIFSQKFLYSLRIIFLKGKYSQQQNEDDVYFRITIIEILINCIKINPCFTGKINKCDFPVAIMKVFEESNIFEEEYICMKFIYNWLEKCPNNLPIFFCQGIAAIAKTNEKLQLGCIEFLRILGLKRPDICSTVDGFRIMINYILEGKCTETLSDKIIYSLLNIVNDPEKRKYFNGFGDFHKIFAIFTKSDFNTNNNDMETQNYKMTEEDKLLEKQLNISINLIKKMLKTWPGYFLIMDDYMSMGSLARALNSDTNYIIKKAILRLYKELLESSYMMLDNFTTISSYDNDYLYCNKIYLAYIIQSLYKNDLFENLLKFDEESTNVELRDFAKRVTIKFAILYSKLTNNDSQTLFCTNSSLRDVNPLFDSITSSVGNISENGTAHFKVKDFTVKDDQSKEDNNNLKVKIMHLLEQAFYHFNCKDNPHLKPENLSSEVIFAIHSVLNMQNVKKYEEQYCIENCKRELFSNDDEIYPQSVKNSKVFEVKEFNQWDWENIDTLLDVVDIKKELMLDLNKQKFFSKLLYNYMPSKNLIISQPWTLNNFIYIAIGNKLFTILSNSKENLNILDASPEEYIFQKSFSWIEDVIQCIDNLITKKEENDQQPFTMKKIYNTLSRSIFSFIGIISQTTQGDEYLEKKGFYKELYKFANSTNQYDYLIATIIDNLNFSSKYVNNWFHEMLLKCSTRIKIYILDNIRCLILEGKSMDLNIDLLIEIINKDYPEVNHVIYFIFKLLLKKGKYIDKFIKNANLINKVNEVGHPLLFVLMRNKNIYDCLTDIIEKEINNTNIKQIVDDYAKELDQYVAKSFRLLDELIYVNNYFLTINLSESNNLYEHFDEFFFLKQLPFYITAKVTEKKEKNNEFILITYMEYLEDNTIILYANPKEGDIISIGNNFNNIQILCSLGKININKECHETPEPSNFVIFSLEDIKANMIPYKNKNNYFIVTKDAVNIILEKSENNFKLISVFFTVKINPNIIYGFKTPINIMTELNNNNDGYHKIVNMKAIETLTGYLEKNENYFIKTCKSALWILAKILSKSKEGVLIEDRFNVIEKIYELFKSSGDYSLKGTIIYIFCFISQNREIKEILKSFDFTYFFNTDICYPIDEKLLQMDNNIMYENEKIIKDVELINKYLKLEKDSQNVYENMTSLINNITNNKAIEQMQDIINKQTKQMNRKKENIFEYCQDVNLYVKILTLLSKFRFKEKDRRLILKYFAGSICSNEVSSKAMKIIERLGDDLILFHELE